MRITEYLTALTGIHPRNEKTIQATQDWERARITRRELESTFREDTGALVSLQVALNFDFVSDGQLTMQWQDHFRPFTTSVAGIRKGPMIRWFNTNTFYFAPVVSGELETDGRAIAHTFNDSMVRSGAITKVILPDPLTFVELSEDLHYSSREKLLFAYCDNVLSPEVKHLSSMGIDYVQFSAPALVARFGGEPVRRVELERVGEGLRSVLKGVNIRSGYHTFFGDASPYLPTLFDLIPTDDLGFDFTETDPQMLEASEKGLIAGIADSRSSFIEPPEELLRRVSGLAEKFKRITLAPSTDLQYVTRSVADEKMRNLSAAKSRLIGE